MTNLLAAFNVHRTLAQGPSLGDLPPAIPPVSVAFSLLLLAAQVLLRPAVLALVSIHVVVKRFMAYRQLARHLLRTPLQLEQCIDCSFTLGAMVLALRIDSERLSASSKA